MKRNYLSWVILIAVILVPSIAQAGGGGEHGTALIAALGLIGVMRFVAAVGEGLIKKAGQSAVLGQLVAGIVMKIVILVVGFEAADQLIEHGLVKGLAEFGVIMLLFVIGLEGNIKEMFKVGFPAARVALVGVVLPFSTGYLMSLGFTNYGYIPVAWVYEPAPYLTHMFMGAVSVATSVGIPGSLFKEFGISQSPEARTVIGAAVIDDVLGLITLSVCSAVVRAVGNGSEVTGTAIAALAGEKFVVSVLFLVISVWIGLKSAPYVGRWMSKIHANSKMKFSIALLFCLGYSYIAVVIPELAAIVGAYAAGLVLDDVTLTLRSRGGQDHEVGIEELMKPFEEHLAPIFFVYTMLQINLHAVANLRVVLIGIGFSIIAGLCKVVAGFVTLRRDTDPLMVGFGMMPRGEVGLIFAAAGASPPFHVLSAPLFGVAIMIVLLTTFAAPPALKWRIAALQARGTFGASTSGASTSATASAE